MRSQNRATIQPHRADLGDLIRCQQNSPHLPLVFDDAR